MSFSVRAALALVSGFAVSFGAIAATVSLPPGLGDLPQGFLLVASLLLCAVGAANVFAGDRRRRMFWLSFLSVYGIAGAIAMIDDLASCNTIPDYLARSISRVAPAIDENVHRSNERFYALQNVLTFSGVTPIAFLGGAVASRIVATTGDVDDA